MTNHSGGEKKDGSRIAASWRALIPAIPVILTVFLLSGCGSKTITGLIWRDDGGRGAASAARVVRTAESQLGKPYRYGGSTPRGFDCSGLIWWAYKQNGVTVPRVTSDQARAGAGVSRRALRPGDILVFNTRQGATGLHTALYTGDGRFVHSPSSGSRVRRDNISNAYWSKRLIKIRRILR